MRHKCVFEGEIGDFTPVKTATNHSLDCFSRVLPPVPYEPEQRATAEPTPKQDETKPASQPHYTVT